MNIEKLGSEYGKHYVISSLLDRDSLVYSFGVGEDITFDLQLIQKTGCKIYAFDPTPKSTEWIKKQNLPENFAFFEYGLSNIDGNINFDPPPNPEWASYKESITGKYSFPVKTMRTILSELNHTKRIDFLKLDIEGSEFSVLDNLLQENIIPVQMSIEFHGSQDKILSWLTNNAILREKYHAYIFPENEVYFLSK
jgi:FkbM family methyltransferase